MWGKNDNNNYLPVRIARYIVLENAQNEIKQTGAHFADESNTYSGVLNSTGAATKRWHQSTAPIWIFHQ